MELPITASANDSMIIGALYWGNALGSATANASTTIDYQNFDAAMGISVAFRLTGVTTASTQYTLGITASEWAWGVVAIEILDSGAGPSSSPSPSIAPKDGIAWGEQSPAAEEEAVTWQRWRVSGGAPINVSGDQDWGAAMVATGTPCIGEVIDTGDANSKTFTVTRDKYGSGSGAVTISIRGSASSFAWDAASPSWSTYSAPTVQSWRYVQLKMEA
jgi:hypothetical protein